MPDPVLSIFRADGVEIFRNTGWQIGPNAAALPTRARSVGAFDLPADKKDSALLITLAPGAFTIEASGKNDSEGVALLKIYEVS